ncbi:MAG: hypothetical protein H0U75_08680 [Legionella sp.]|nr:hypothetical protein [Legionella sp.]
MRELIIALIQLGIRLDVRNKDNKLPKEVIHTGYLINILNEGYLMPAYQLLAISATSYGSGARFNYSRIYPGIRLTNDLNLYYGSKYPQKRCEVQDKFPLLNQADGALSLHEGLALSGAYQKGVDTSVNNYVTINIGFVVSTKPHVTTAKKDRRRQFITVPIRDKEFGIVWSSRQNIAVHSESLLYDYLATPESINNIISTMQLIYKIVPGYKIYALIVDLHTFNNMCSTSCTPQTFDNQLGGSFIQLLEEKLGRFRICSSA